MRSDLAAIAAVLAIGASAGCSATPETPGSSAVPPSTTTASVKPENAAVCAAARSVILDSTAQFSAAMARAVAAGEAGDLPARDTAMAELRTIFAKWSAGLRATAEKAGDPQLESTLLAYAGGVDSTIARVKSFADLDNTLYTFDDQELDVMASQFADVCP